jgi:SPP1 gp7 family putative phage head morphogenesis protein
MKNWAMDWTDKRLKELEERIAEAYKTAEKEITAKMQAYLDRFAKQDAVMLAKYKNGEITKAELTEWRTNHFMMGKNWQAVKDSIAGDILKTDAISAGIVNNALIDVYTQNANYAYYELEQGTGTGLSFNLYDRNAVENLLKDNPDFMPHYEPKTPIVERWNKQHITSEMLQGILQGENIPKIANRMATVVGMEKNSAIRNARTYTTSVENKAKMDRYEEAEEMGIDLEKEWMATLDDRTRDSHRELDGVRVANDERFPNGLMYPADPSGDPAEVYNCRCRIVPRIKGRQYDRSGRANKLGDMSYEEWKRGKEKEQPEQTGASWVDRIKEIQQMDVKDEASIKEAGHLIAEQVHSGYLNDMQEEREKLKTEYTEAINKYHEYDNKIDEIRNTKEYEEAKGIHNGWKDISESEIFETKAEAEAFYQKSIEEQDKLREQADKYYDKYYEAWRKYAIPDYNANAENLKETLSQVREMGSGNANIKEHLNNTRSKVRENIEWAYNHYPTAWVNASVDNSDLTPKKVSRGFYSHFRREIAISGEGDSANRVAVHELGHRFERVVDGIKDAEKEFYDRRTAGESLQWLGTGYRRDEKTRPDDFLDAYMGKDYSGTAYELVSMGFETAYCDPVKLSQDADMEEWIYGLLATM